MRGELYFGFSPIEEREGRMSWAAIRGRVHFGKVSLRRTLDYQKQALAEENDLGMRLLRRQRISHLEALIADPTRRLGRENRTLGRCK